MFTKRHLFIVQLFFLGVFILHSTFTSTFHSLTPSPLPVQPVDTNQIPILEGKNSPITQKDVYKIPSLALQEFQTPSILFIVGDPLSLDPMYDQPYYDYLTVNLSYSVILHDDNNSYSYSGFDAIIVSQSIVDDSVSSLGSANIPILNMKDTEYDTFALTSQAKSANGISTFYILNNTHYITQNLLIEAHSIYSSPSSMTNYAKYHVNTDHEIVSLAVASDTTSSRERSLVALDKGKLDWNLVPAPERRSFWGGLDATVLNTNGWNLWERTINWILYDDITGNATINVEVIDLDNKMVPNANVTLLNATNASIYWTQNTTGQGFTNFTNIPYGLYNITIEFEDTINTSLANLEIAATQTYFKGANFTYQIHISEYIDNSTPLISNINSIPSNNTINAIVTDESLITTVKLNITMINVSNDAILRDNSLNMVTNGGGLYYNDTAIAGFPDNWEIQINYNITAIDIAENIITSTNYSLLIGDVLGPIIHDYNTVDYGNGTLEFYTNISDLESSVANVTIRINDSYFNMELNSSNLWVYRSNFVCNLGLNYTIFSAIDSLGNENGSKYGPGYLAPLPDYRLYVPQDFQSPSICNINDTFSVHKMGYVVINCSVVDWNAYQSGVNTSSVYVTVSINGENTSFLMNHISGDNFSFNYTFTNNDNVSFYITAKDLEGNIVQSSCYGYFVINDTSSPSVTFNALEYRNGTVTFTAFVTDWPANQTSAILNYTQNPSGGWTQVTMNAINDTHFTITIHGFDPLTNTTITYYVIANDSSENIFTPSPAQYKTIELTDSVPPVVTFDAVEYGNGTVTFTAFATDWPANQTSITLNYTQNPSGEWIQVTMNTINDTHFTITIHGFDPLINTTITYYVVANDSSNNAFIPSTAKYKTIELTDSVTPVVTFDAVEYGNGTVTFTTFVTDWPANQTSAILNYTQNPSGEWTQVTMNAINDTHSTITIHGFDPLVNTTITYYVVANDSSNNVFIPSPAQYKTIEITDLVPPVVSFDATSFDNNTIIFTAFVTDWPANQTSATLYYTQNPSGTWINLSMTLTNTTYFSTVIHGFDSSVNNIVTYYIVVNDSSNNTFTPTLAQYQLIFLKDVIAPEVTSIKATEYGNGTVEFVAVVIDRPANQTSSTLYFRQGSSGTWNSISMNYLNLTFATIRINFENFTPNDIWFYVVAKDSNNNMYQPDPIDYRIVYLSDKIPPTVTGLGVVNYKNGSILVWVKVEDWGSGIANISLIYHLDPIDNILGEGSSLSENVIQLDYNGTLYFALILVPENVSFNGVIYMTDMSDNIEILNLSDQPLIIDDFTTPDTIQNEPNNHNFDITSIILIIIGITIITLIIGCIIYLKSSNHSTSSLKRLEKDKDHFYDILNIKSILCRNKDGINFYEEHFQLKDQYGELISGLSSAISSLLTDILEKPQEEGEFDLLERKGLSILSHNGKYSVITLVTSKKVSKYLKHQIIKIHKEIEMIITEEQLSQTDFNFVYKQIKEIFYSYLDLGLHKPLLVDPKLLLESKHQFKKNEKKLISSIPLVPSYVDGFQVFHALTLIYSFSSQGILASETLPFVTKLYHLKVLRNLTFEELNVMNIPTSYRFI